MKLAVYSCMTPDLAAETLAASLEEIGYSGVEWTIGYRNAVWDRSRQWHISDDDLEREIPRFRALAERHRLQTVGLGSQVSLHEPEALERVLRAAAELDCPYVRLVTNGYNGSRPYQELLTEARNALPEVVRLSRATGVKPLLEIHPGTILPSASAAARLVEGFDPAYLGLIHDAGNMVHEGYENWQMGLEIIAPYLAHVHVKNYGWKRQVDTDGIRWAPEAAALDEGVVDYSRVIAALRGVGYGGYYSLEDFRGGYGCVPVGITSQQKLQEDFAAMSRLLA